MGRPRAHTARTRQVPHNGDTASTDGPQHTQKQKPQYTLTPQAPKSTLPSRPADRPSSQTPSPLLLPQPHTPGAPLSHAWGLSRRADGEPGRILLSGGTARNGPTRGSGAEQNGINQFLRMTQPGATQEPARLWGAPRADGVAGLDTCEPAASSQAAPSRRAGQKAQKGPRAADRAARPVRHSRVGPAECEPQGHLRAP